MAGPVATGEVHGGLIRSDAIRDAVERYIQDRWAGTGSNVAVEFRSVPDSISVAGMPCTLRVDDGGAHQLRGKSTVMVEAISAGSVERRIAVSVTVRTFGSVLVASRQLDRHQRLTPGDVRLETLETTTLSNDVLTSPDQMVNMRTKRIIAIGSVLTGSMTEQLPVVGQGEVVKLQVRSRSVLLSMQAVAKEDGRPGNVITVQKMGSHDRIKARVIGPGAVEIVTE